MIQVDLRNDKVDFEDFGGIINDEVKYVLGAYFEAYEKKYGKEVTYPVFFELAQSSKTFFKMFRQNNPNTTYKGMKLESMF